MLADALVNRNSDTAIGNTMLRTSVGTSSRASIASIMAGSDAIEDWVLSAITCAGSAARANRRTPIRPKIATAG